MVNIHMATNKKRVKGIGSHHHFIKPAAKAALKLSKLNETKVVLPRKILPNSGPKIVRIQRSLPGAVRLFVSSGEGCQEISVLPKEGISIEKLKDAIIKVQDELI